MTKQDYFDFLGFKRYCKEKGHPFNVFSDNRSEVRQIRRKLKCDNQGIKFILERGDMNDIDRGVWEISKMKWEGEKDALKEYLWKNRASVICSDYSPTGRPFTVCFIAAHIMGDEWKIAELKKIDC